MVQRNVSTVEGYLEALPPDRRAVIERTLAFVRAHVPDGFQEGIAFGMIGWVVPLERYPDTYNGQPLGIVSLAAQKRHNALYLSAPYADPALNAKIEDAYAEAGMKLDMGKSCVRFQRFDQLHTEVLGEVIAALSPDAFIDLYERARSSAPSTRTRRR